MAAPSLVITDPSLAHVRPSQTISLQPTTHPIRIPTDERCDLSPVRLPLTLVAPLIKLHMGSLLSFALPLALLRL
jgi:hypothetical protein